MISFALIIIYIIFIFCISLVFKKLNPSNKELLRKIIHIGIGPIIPLAIFLGISQTYAITFAGVITFLILLNYIYKLFPIIEDVDRRSLGTLFYCLSLLTLIIIFWDKNPSALIAGFFIMSFGDGFAGLIGKSFKSKEWIILNQKKSLIGTLTMFLISLIVVTLLGIYYGYGLHFQYLIVALIATFLEQISIFGIDNLIVPLSSSIIYSLLIPNL